MNRCIDADELMFWIASHDHELKDESNYVDRGMFTIEIIRAIEALLTAEPARHGRWINHLCEDGATDGIFCSRCDYETDRDRRPNYCPNCGAKMDLK